MKVSRRGLLNATLGSLAYGCAFGRRLGRGWAGEHPLSDHMRIIGQAYLAEHPSDVALLRQELAASGLWPPQRAPIEDLIREDFRNGRTVTVKGWVLSSTEAKLCALVAGG